MTTVEKDRKRTKTETEKNKKLNNKERLFGSVPDTSNNQDRR